MPPIIAPPRTNYQAESTLGYNSRSGYYASYSGCDINVMAMAGNRLKKFAELQTISYSVHREKMPVRFLGRKNPGGFSRGPRTIAGSLIFTAFDRNAFWDILVHNPRDLPDDKGEAPIIDEIPPIDVTIVFNNEFGYSSGIRIYGIELVDHGMTMSVDDMYTEQICSYQARGITEMAPEGSEHGPEGNLYNNNAVFFNGYPVDAEVHKYYGALRSIYDLNKQLIDVMTNDPDNTALIEEINSAIAAIKRAINSSQSSAYSPTGEVDEYGRYRDAWNKGRDPYRRAWPEVR